jgi:hypothetical protein
MSRQGLEESGEGVVISAVSASREEARRFRCYGALNEQRPKTQP